MNANCLRITKLDAFLGLFLTSMVGSAPANCGLLQSGRETSVCSIRVQRLHSGALCLGPFLSLVLTLRSRDSADDGDETGKGRLLAVRYLAS